MFDIFSAMIMQCVSNHWLDRSFFYENWILPISNQ